MRMILGGLALACAVAGSTAPAGAAPVYRWCADYGARDIVTCAYDTFQQCLASAGGGAGGFCRENPAWHPAPAAPPPHKARRRAG